MFERAFCILANLYLANLIIAALFVPIAWAFSRMFGLQPTRICIFFWKIYSFGLGGIKVELGWMPFGASIAYREGEFDSLPAIRAIVLMLTGLTPTLLVALTYCWWVGNLAEMQAAFGQIWTGTMAPFTHAVHFIRRFNETAQGSVSPASLGLLATKLFPYYLFGVVLFCVGRVVAIWSTEPKRFDVLTFGAILLYLVYFMWILVAGKFILGG